MNHPWIKREGNFVYCQDRLGRIMFETDKPKAILIDNFLSIDECMDLRSLATPTLRRSEAVNDETGEAIVDSDRQSEGTFLKRGDSIFLEIIEDRIATTFNWDTNYTEEINVLKYTAEDRYLPHNDWFDTRFEGNKKNVERGNQRVATLLMYLHTPTAGGETYFPETGLRVYPHKGSALLFVYPEPESSMTLHSGEVVISGEKMVATKWFRAK